MKIRLITVLCSTLLWVGFFSLPLGMTSCSTPPSARVVQYQTLQAVGTAAQTAVRASTQALKDGSVTVDQWQKIADFYDNKWQPAYTVAVVAAQSDLSSAASPDLQNLLQQLLMLANQLTKKP